MNILVTATTFPRWQHDAEPAFVYFLSRLLAKRGHTVINLVPHHPGAKLFEEKDGMKIYRFKYFFEKQQRLCYDGGILANLKKSRFAKLQVPLLVAAEYLAIRKILKKEKIDIMHAHWIIPQGYLAALIKKKFGIPYIVTAHAGDVFPLKSTLLKRFGRIALRNCDACTVNSLATKKAVEAVMPLDRIHVIPMGVDLSAFSPSKKDASLRKQLGMPDQLILFVGRLAEKKGLTFLLDAMPTVLKKFPKAKLLIIGDGPLKSALEQQAQQLGIHKSVIFIGKMSNDELPRYYATADLFVGPSIVTASGDTEGLGVVFLEALASGTAVIGSNVGGIPDIIKDGITGLLVEQKNAKALAEKIIEMLRNLKLRQTLVKNGQKHIQRNYDWETIADEFDLLLKNVAGQKE